MLVSRAALFLSTMLPFIVSGGCDTGRIDTHLHAIPPAYKAAVEAAGGDPSGFPTPDWSLEAAIESMKAIGSEIAILSVSTPGVPIVGTGEEARALARTLNTDLADYALSTNCSSSQCVSFFGVLPDWQDVEGTIAEIDFLYTHQRLCNGVTVYTVYGGKLLGDPMFKPIWAKLQSYKALIFLHPGVLDVTPKFLGNGIPQPIVDYPLATTRTAIDLVMTGTVHASPDVDIILAHAGGTVPYVAARAMGSLLIPEVAEKAAVTFAEAQLDFSRFYYDIALSTSTAQFDGLLDFTEPSHVLFGSDFPYAPQTGIKAGVIQYETFVATNPRGILLAPAVLRSNAVGLLNKHAMGKTCRSRG